MVQYLLQFQKCYYLTALSKAPNNSGVNEVFTLSQSQIMFTIQEPKIKNIKLTL